MATIELDPAIRELAANSELMQLPDASPETLEQMRALSIPAELSDEVLREEHVVREDPRMIVRVHTRKGPAQPLRPCVYSIHGGGYVAGSVDLDDALFDDLCRATGCVGISIDYRLAPEVSYPIPLEDCYEGLAWTFANAERLGIDPMRVGIHGVSGGGGLAAALALLVRDRGEYRLAWQLLDCPMLDDRQITPSSQADGLLSWSRESNTFGWRSYLGDLHGSDDVPYLAAPARAKDLSGLPPAYVCVGGADGFRDEDIAYAMRLGECGTPCELHVYPGGPHGTFFFVTTDIGHRYARDKDHWLKLQVETARVRDA